MEYLEPENMGLLAYLLDTALGTTESEYGTRQSLRACKLKSNEDWVRHRKKVRFHTARVNFIVICIFGQIIQSYYDLYMSHYNKHQGNLGQKESFVTRATLMRRQAVHHSVLTGWRNNFWGMGRNHGHTNRRKAGAPPPPTMSRYASSLNKVDVSSTGMMNKHKAVHHDKSHHTSRPLSPRPPKRRGAGKKKSTKKRV